MLNVNDILEIVDCDPTSTAGSFRATQLSRRERDDVRRASAVQLEWLDSIETMWPVMDLSEVHVHPVPDPRKVAVHDARPVGPLADFERHWLNELGPMALIEPYQLSDTDVRRLAALWVAAEDNGGDDREFVEPLWRSVDNFHRIRAAQSRIEQLGRLNRDVLPPQTGAAIAAALRAAQPALEPDDARREAQRLLRDHLTQSRVDRERERSELRQEIERLQRKATNA